MHRFPANIEKSKTWQETLGIKFSSLTLHNYRLCNNHFSENCYANLRDLRLVRDAVPNRFIENECTSEASSMENLTQVNPDSWVENAPLTISDMTDKCHAGTSNQPPVTPTRKLFRSIEGLSNLENSPRKLKLVRMINRKENQLRKVKRLCKKRGNDIKYLANLSDSAVVHGLFQDVQSLTSNFLVAQIRCSRSKMLRGRRWTFDDKVMVGQNEAKMEARFAAYELDTKCPYSFRSMYKVTDNYLQPVMQYTMKVSVAAQVLSHTVGTYLYSMTSVGALDQRVVATATFLTASMEETLHHLRVKY